MPHGESKEELAGMLSTPRMSGACSNHVRTKLT